MSAAVVPHLNYASLSDPGKKRLANEDATFCDPRMGLFVVCDGVGGMPSGEAASHIMAYSLGHLIRRELRQRQQVTEDQIADLLRDVLGRMNRELYTNSRDLAALCGMGATLVATLIDGRTAYVLHVGDSRAYLLRRGSIRRLSRDHSSHQHKHVTDDASGELIDLGERRVLTQFMGREAGVNPEVGRLHLEPGDRLLLCTDGLTDTVSDRDLNQALSKSDSPTQACSSLVQRANQRGGPDNITLAVVEFRGVRSVDRHAPTNQISSSQSSEPPRGTAQQVYDALQMIEQDMAWLAAGAKEAAQPSHLSALAAVKRRVGHNLYRAYLERHPVAKDPAYIFHQLCADPRQTWRQQYQQHLQMLEKPLASLTAGDVRISPLLSSEETGLIFKTLWRNWRAVEQRYFATCQRDAIDTGEKTLDILIEHMHESVRTLSGLLALLPRYMRDDAGFAEGI